MRKFSFNYSFTLFIILVILWVLFTSDRSTDLKLTRKIKRYYQEVIISRLEEKNIKILSAFDFQDGYITVSLANIQKSGITVYCHYFDKNRRPIPDASRQISFFTNTIARCPKHENIISSFVALSYSHRKSSLLIPIPIKIQQYFENKREISICVELKTKPNWLEVASFIEFHRKLNFSFFYFTTLDLDAYSRRIFDDYIRLGIVHLTSLRRTKFFDKYLEIQRTNCLLNAQFSSKLVTFLRLDERVLNIPFFIENLTETRLAIKTISFEGNVDRYSNETETRRLLANYKYGKHAQLRKLIDPTKIVNTEQISEDFVYKKASKFIPLLTETVVSSTLSRLKYNYNTRPIYCDEFDMYVLSWCPVHVYHCHFRDEQNKKMVMENRQKLVGTYRQQTVQW